MKKLLILVIRLGLGKIGGKIEIIKLMERVKIMEKEAKVMEKIMVLIVKVSKKGEMMMMKLGKLINFFVLRNMLKVQVMDGVFLRNPSLICSQCDATTQWC